MKPDPSLSILTNSGWFSSGFEPVAFCSIYFLPFFDESSREQATDRSALIGSKKLLTWKRIFREQ